MDLKLPNKTGKTLEILQLWQSQSEIALISTPKNDERIPKIT